MGWDTTSAYDSSGNANHLDGTYQGGNIPTGTSGLVDDPAT